MKNPLMPSGVEHVELGFTPSARGRVKNPLMPSGVEHPSRATRCTCAAGVKNPLMPSGVEHSDTVIDLLVLDGEESFDAVRR